MLTRYIDLYGKTLALFLVFEIPFRNTDLGTNTVRLVLRNGISKAKNRASVLPYKSMYRECLLVSPLNNYFLPLKETLKFILFLIA